MPYALQPACAVPGCPNRKPCPEHRRKDSRRGSRGYDSPEWKATRLAFLAANPVCVDCGGPSEHADHVVARRDGGTDDPENLRN